tara:strand:- start:191 stop:520 length:330 start_codon:yes stop_codon:yes gene_type:complete
MTPEQEKEWNEWLADRPDSVKAVGALVNPYTLYINNKRRDQRVSLVSIYENGTVKICVLRQFNLSPSIDFEVFGVDPHDLEPTTDMRPFDEWVKDNPIGSTPLYVSRGQ